MGRDLKGDPSGHGRGKLILFGEHAVVYGQPAIVAGLDRGARASVAPGEAPRLRVHDGATGELFDDVVADAAGSPLQRAWAALLDNFGQLRSATPLEAQVSIDLPIGAGLGSSAAMSAALARAIAAQLGGADDDPAIGRAVAAAEDVFHGRASGIDQAAALSGGVFVFQKVFGSPRTDPIVVPPVRVAVCRAEASASTATMVAGVAALHERQPEVCRRVDDAIGGIVGEARGALEDGDWATIGELMNLNHGLLAALGVTTATLDRACHIARDAGALGAKITGAGGGGCVVALGGDAHDEVLDAWRAEGWDVFDFGL